jgi:hypothetical protein
LILPEVATTEIGGSKASWIQDALSNGLTQFPRVRGLVWFDVDKEQSWSLGSSPGSLAAWNSRSTAGRFKVGPSVRHSGRLKSKG